MSATLEIVATIETGETTEEGETEVGVGIEDLILRGVGSIVPKATGHFLTSSTDSNGSRRHDTRSRSPVRPGRNARDSTHDSPGPRGPRSDRRSPATRPPPRSNVSQPTAPGLKTKVKQEPKAHEGTDLDPMEVEEDEDEEEARMRRIMGFAGFKSTKNTKVPGNEKNWGIFRFKKSEARQYMNRKDGFNRPLSPGRDAAPSAAAE